MKNLYKKATTPQAYSVYACIGVVVTTALAIWSTRRKCKNEKNPGGENLEKEVTREEVIEEIKDTVVTYAPTAISAALTLYFVNRCSYEWMQYNGVINSAYLNAIGKTNRYRDFLAGTAVSAVNKIAHPASDGKKWFCIRGLGNQSDVYFEATDYDVMSAMYHLNRNFQKRGTASAREFFAFLQILDQYNELDQDYLGWDVGIMLEDWGLEFPWIDFGTKTYEENGVEITEITYLWDPEYSEEGKGYAEGNPLAYPVQYDPDWRYPRE